MVCFNRLHPVYFKATMTASQDAPWSTLDLRCSTLLSLSLTVTWNGEFFSSSAVGGARRLSSELLQLSSVHKKGGRFDCSVTSFTHCLPSLNFVWLDFTQFWNLTSTCILYPPVTGSSIIAQASDLYSVALVRAAWGYSTFSCVCINQSLSDLVWPFSMIG